VMGRAAAALSVAGVARITTSSPESLSESAIRGSEGWGGYKGGSRAGDAKGRRPVQRALWGGEMES
jgi:hypothetical protein